MDFQIFMFLNNLKPLFLLSIILVLLQSCSCANSSLSCRQEERDALIRFGRTIDPSFFNSSESLEQGQDCCDWSWITCDAVTRHVITLTVSSFRPYVFSPTNLSSLVQLKFLNYLDLTGLVFNGSDCQIPEFIGSMKRLKFLELSWTSFCGRVPPHLGNLTNLEFLSLSNGKLSLDEPRWISHLVSLKHLDLSYVKVLEGARNDLITVLSTLPSLSYLDLHHCGLSNVPMFDDIMFNSTFYFPRLQYLDLSGNYLQGKIPSAIQNMTSLTYLDMSYNQFNSSIPSWFGGFANLQYLDLSKGNIFESYFNLSELNLSGNQLSGIIPSSLGNLSVLRALDLSGNHLTGNIPSSLGRLQSLTELYLQNNHFNGGINIGQLSRLEYLDISENNLSAPIPYDFGRNMTQLRYLSLEHNLITGTIPPSLCDMFLLEELNLVDNILTGSIPNCGRHNVSSTLWSLDLSNNHLSGTVSENIRQQLQNLEYLDLSNNRISGDIPEDIGTKLPNLLQLFLNDNLMSGPIPPSLCDMFLLEELNLADNILTGSIPNCGRHNVSSTLWRIDLSNNHLSGTVSENIRQQLQNLEYLDLSNNRISENIPKDIGTKLPKLHHLLLNDNHMSGPIPPSLCDMFHLEVLDLSNNTLTRNIPDCWLRESSSLVVINLSSNKLTGVIPSSIMNLSTLWSVHLNKNNLHGELPEALGFLFVLVILDLGENNLSGDVPSWIGESLSFLQILRLKDNKLNGVIPRQLCGLSGLQILDLAGNDLDGEIPSCFSFIHGMSDVLYPPSDINSPIPFLPMAPQAMAPSGDWSKEKMTEVLKGSEMEYTKNLKYVITLDLSRNKLIGSVPEDLTLLNRLDCLNLSYNALSGPIPEKIGSLKLLESLDLSNNQLSGTIPQSISDLSFLNHLNMANNNLSGRIPKGNQLDTVYDSDHSIYDGNPQLCGEPLPKLCPSDKLTPLSPYMPSKHDEDDQDVLEQPMFYVVVMLGFGTGFWGVVGTLMFMKSWRAAYFKFADDIVDKVYVVVKVKVAKLKRSRRRRSIG